MILRFLKIKKFNYLENAVIFIGLLLLMLLLGVNVIFSTYITQNAGEIPVIVRSFFPALLLLTRKPSISSTSVKKNPANTQGRR